MRFHSKTYWGSLELYDRNTSIQIYNKKYMIKKKVQVLSLRGVPGTPTFLKQHIV
jgi:hypothetical protein